MDKLQTDQDEAEKVSVKKSRINEALFQSLVLQTTAKIINTLGFVTLFARLGGLCRKEWFLGGYRCFLATL